MCGGTAERARRCVCGEGGRNDEGEASGRAGIQAWGGGGGGGGGMVAPQWVGVGGTGMEAGAEAVANGQVQGGQADGCQSLAQPGGGGEGDGCYLPRQGRASSG